MAQINWACLLLGSNINPQENIAQALVELNKYLKIKGTSSSYWSKAVGSDGPDFINAAVLIESEKDLKFIEEKILAPIENKLGRIRTDDKNSPRTIDIDVIIYNDTLLDDSLFKYSHIAVPVAELLPDYLSEEGESLKSVAISLMRKVPVWGKDSL